MDGFDFQSPDYTAVIAERQRRLLALRADPAKLQAAKIFYRDNPVEFVEDWVWTYDPRTEEKFIPMALWPKQAEYLLWLKARLEASEDGLVEKSRDAGATWLNVAFAVWCFLFREGSKVSFGSRKENLVDKLGDLDSILEKGRLVLRYLPAELLPKGFDVARQCGFMRFVNPESGATITGEAGDNIGRGGRSTIYFKDESAFYERPDLIDAALSQNSDCKIDVSTPNGNGNPFYRKRFGGQIAVFIFDWRDDPRKDQTWYEKQKATLEPWILAQEVDRDYNASVEGLCIPADYVRAAVGLELPAEGAVVAALDVADEGGDENCLMARRGVVVSAPECWREGNTTQTARRAWARCRELDAEVLAYDSIGVGAGVKGETSELERLGDGPAVVGINTGSTDLPGLYEPGRKNADMFLNLRAQLWWLMRRRLQRTYEHVKGIKTWAPEELVSLPNDPQLIAELSQPLYDFSESGKIRIEAKAKMRNRGVKSPNRADTLVMLFAPEHLLFAHRSFGNRFTQGARA
jgi:phage terminase large subunit